MTDLSGMIRWNAGFVRGLAQSVLDRAKAIRTSLTSSDSLVPEPAGKARATRVRAAGTRSTVARKAAKPVAKRKSAPVVKTAAKRTSPKTGNRSRRRADV